MKAEVDSVQYVCTISKGCQPLKTKKREVLPFWREFYQKSGRSMMKKRETRNID